jgi:predicted nucleotidyltransferase
MVGVADRVLESILSIILSHRPARKVLVFGSRARGTAGRTSDIDLAILDERWSQRDIDLVHNRLEEEAPTALSIDLLAVHLLSNGELRKRILAEGVVIHD